MEYEIVKGILKGNQVCFAEIVGVSKQQVSNQIKKKFLNVDPDGKLDLEKSVSKWYKYRNENMLRNHRKKIVSHAEAMETISKMKVGNNTRKPVNENLEFKTAKNFLLQILRNDETKRLAFIKQLIK